MKPELKCGILMNNTKTEIYLYSIYKSENPVGEFKKLSWSRKEYEEKIERMSKRYGDDAKELIEWFNEKFEEYYTKYKTKPEKVEKVDFVKENAKRILTSVVTSGLSIAEYANENLYCDMSDIRGAIKVFTQAYTDSYRKVVAGIDSQENEWFKLEMMSILDEMNINEEFDIVDYYLRTRLCLKDFRNIVGQNDKLSLFMSKYSKYTTRQKYDSGINFRNTKYAEKCIKNGKEITIEDKRKVFEYMETNQIPYGEQTYNAVLERLLKGKLIEESKQKVKTI